MNKKIIISILAIALFASGCGKGTSDATNEATKESKAVSSSSDASLTEAPSDTQLSTQNDGHEYIFELAQYNSPVRCTEIYGENRLNISYIELTDAVTGDYIGKLFGVDDFESIIDMGVMDFNADGLTDIVTIGESKYGKGVVLSEAESDIEASGENYNIFDFFSQLGEEEITEIGADYTINGIRDALIGDNKEGRFDNYQDAYKFLARLYNLKGILCDYSEFDLIYADEDDIPELVAKKTICEVSLITFEDGHLHYLIHNWGFGAFGNPGYFYAPGKGIYYNFNSNADCSYESFMSKRDIGEIETDYWSEGDFNCSFENDIYVAVPVEGAVIYHNETEKAMTDEELIAEIEKMRSNKFELIDGKLDYEELLAKLQK